MGAGRCFGALAAHVKARDLAFAGWGSTPAPSSPAWLAWRDPAPRAACLQGARRQRCREPGAAKHPGAAAHGAGIPLGPGERCGVGLVVWGAADGAGWVLAGVVEAPLPCPPHPTLACSPPRSSCPGCAAAAASSSSWAQVRHLHRHAALRCVHGRARTAWPSLGRPLLPRIYLERTTDAALPPCTHHTRSPQPTWTKGSADTSPNTTAPAPTSILSVRARTGPAPALHALPGLASRKGDVCRVPARQLGTGARHGTDHLVTPRPHGDSDTP